MVIDHQSRIVIKTFSDNQSHVYYAGSKNRRFYSDILGKHHWLQNGNLLITEGSKGRAFEIDKNGKIVWEYINLVEDGYVGIIEEMQRLPKYYTKEYVSRIIQGCQNSN